MLRVRSEVGYAGIHDAAGTFHQVVQAGLCPPCGAGGFEHEAQPLFHQVLQFAAAQRGLGLDLAKQFIRKLYGRFHVAPPTKYGYPFLWVSTRLSRLRALGRTTSKRGCKM